MSGGKDAFQNVFIHSLLHTVKRKEEMKNVVQLFYEILKWGDVLCFTEEKFRLKLRSFINQINATLAETWHNNISQLLMFVQLFCLPPLP